MKKYKTDAILRIKNTDRYDDRDEVRTNLIESYDRLMQFVRKHLPDPFYLEGDKRVSLREIIFREAIVNTLIHREFTNAFPARLIITREQVSIENWNLPVKHGLISPDMFYTHPKNPNILQVFKEIRMADELGSGVKNIFKYTSLFSAGKNPQINEHDTFKVIIPVSWEDTGQVIIKSEQINEGVNNKNEGVNEGVNNVNEGVNSGEGVKIIENILENSQYNDIGEHVKSGIYNVFSIISNNEGTDITALINTLNKSKATIERYLKILRACNAVEFRGAPKTGKYWLTSHILKNKAKKTDTER